jgi:predicted transposase/invertase (TIGR01784 family)
MVKVKFEDADDIIDICRDNVFKAVFTKNSPESEKALEGLLSCLIGRQLSVLTIVTNEPAADNLRDRQIRFDINCKAEDGELINVEMTMYPNDFEPVRLEYYASKLFTGQEIRGRDKTFDDLKPAYQISLLVRKTFFDDASVLHCFEYYDPERKVTLGGRSHIITVELNKLEAIVEKPVEKMTAQERWSVFFRYSTDAAKRQKINQIAESEEGIAMACQVLRTVSRDEAERARLMSEYKYEVDHQSQMIQARRTGLAEGLEKGHSKGRVEAAQEFLSALDSGKSLEEIKRLLRENAKN